LTIISSADVDRIEITTVPLPDHVHDPSGTYTASGNVAVLHRTGAPGADEFAVSIVADDGSDFRTIFEGSIPQHSKANGIRLMPFADNTRFHLGDWILECEPDIDTCRGARLVPVEYPWGVTESPLTTHHWSEIIVSPDNDHVAWTMLRSDMGAAAAWGRLRREAERYVIDDATIISGSAELVPDPERDGFVTVPVTRGGEVKQFVRGGTAISQVGDGGGFLPDSVVQELDGEGVIPVTRTPGYDETTIFSPDEQLGIVMTSRASEPTNPAILGLVPRPCASLAGRGVSWAAYMYTVSGVRTFRGGNVGPALVSIDRSSSDSDYVGTDLSDPEGRWVYYSPMSWHPSSTRAMWMEGLREITPGGEHPKMRIRVARLLDYAASAAVPVAPAPKRIPYGLTGEDARASLSKPAPDVITGRIAGRHSGHVDVERRAGDIASGRAATTSIVYSGYSDDGKAFYDGSERSESSFATGTVYTADLAVTGAVDAEMRLRMTWTGVADGTRLVFANAADGSPASHGFARLGERRLEVDDLVE